MKLFKKSRVFQKLEQTAKHRKREITTLYFALRDPRTPFVSKLLILLTVAYALSPIDLIPDFIPVLGLLVTCYFPITSPPVFFLRTTIAQLYYSHHGYFCY
ncbi:MAG: YkvA family protein [Fibrobacterota bacterium]|nr:DUF1232 domain-containing protein [Chitinispirillaceae bacterium]